MLSRIYQGLRQALRVLRRPVRRDRGLKGVVVQPYRGYGSKEEIYLMGRVFRQPRFGTSLPAGTVVREIAGVLRRLARWGLGDVPVTARFAGVERTIRTDRDGYFHVEIRPGDELDAADAWHTVRLEATRGGQTATAEGRVYVPPPTARRIVISDIDDTVMVTGVASKAKMLWRLFIEDAERRVAFPGVSALYRGLHGGPDGHEANPMLYVSRAPWSIYEVLETFFRLERIPDGPILFLREWGLTLQRPLPRRARDHKRDLIEGMLRRYPDLPFLLIGDSGQHDPEIYASIVHAHPGRVQAVYIRDVDAAEGRRDEIRALAEEMAEAGSPLVLASDSRTMAEHAAREGLISESARARVAEARADEAAAPRRHQRSHDLRQRRTPWTTR